MGRSAAVQADRPVLVSRAVAVIVIRVVEPVARAKKQASNCEHTRQHRQNKFDIHRELKPVLFKGVENVRRQVIQALSERDPKPEVVSLPYRAAPGLSNGRSRWCSDQTIAELVTNLPIGPGLQHNFGHLVQQLTN